ncbi:MAG: hypothetical protein VB024_00615 [Dysgonamonadaceae bacterium]|jgi:hypothetical protein|nr:hypothetical protein [Dysgonamonadaceae bacterium]MDD3309386.1 hypothetical protein [Dysgonamonadaceae bacterium]MDD3900326.1 hypothetical protein [Dysgonamonadaceae bacterium]MDD4398401.1 hypothetical protein [Dysgonamonadaceae bacterium]MEA5080107.1 hypothetical protein [Dysgonamonadaceae bacterium]
MKSLFNHFLVILILAMLVFGFGIQWIQTTYFPESVFKGYWILPVFFFVFGVVLLIVLGKAVKSDSKSLIKKYMAMKVAKVIFSLTLVIIYWVMNKSDIYNFAVMFIIYYLIFLIIETYILLKSEKWMKKELERLNNMLKQSNNNKEQQNIINEK